MVGALGRTGLGYAYTGLVLRAQVKETGKGKRKEQESCGMS